MTDTTDVDDRSAENSVLVGDSRTVLAELEEDQFDLVVTSPPYWDLRDYDGAGTEWPDGWTGQLGHEPAPEQFVTHLLDVFDQVQRVLKPSGLIFVNLDDTYTTGTTREPCAPYKSRNGIPERFVIGMLDRGWVYRNDVVWEKTNAMPEKVTDRLARRWEHVYVFTPTSRQTWADLDAVREEHAESSKRRADRNTSGAVKHSQTDHAHEGGVHAGDTDKWLHDNGKNPGDVLTTSTASYSGAHFSVFPEDLPEFAIRFGCPPKVCPECGAPYEAVRERGDPYDIAASGRRQAQRAVELAKEHDLTDDHIAAIRAVGLNYDGVKMEGFKDGAGRNQDDVEELAEEARDVLGSYGREFLRPPEHVTGYEPRCDHDFVDEAPPGTVLDPFGGSGTTGKVARALDRRYTVIEISQEYAEQARDRISGKYERTKQSRQRAERAQRKADRDGHTQASLEDLL